MTAGNALRNFLFYVVAVILLRVKILLVPLKTGYSHGVGDNTINTMYQCGSTLQPNRCIVNNYVSHQNTDVESTQNFQTNVPAFKTVDRYYAKENLKTPEVKKVSSENIFSPCTRD